MLGRQRLGPVGVGVDDRDQLDPVGQFGGHLAVLLTDHPGADEDETGAVGRGGFRGRPPGLCWLGHANSIPSDFRMSVNAFQALVHSSAPEKPPVAL